MSAARGLHSASPAVEDAPAVQAVLDAAESADYRRASSPRAVTSPPSGRVRGAGSPRIGGSPSTPDGTVAAVALVWPETAGEVTADHYVHPDHRGRGLGDALLDIIEARAAQLPARRPDGAERHAGGLVRGLGRRAAAPRSRGADSPPSASTSRWRIDLRDELAAPSWPSGIVARGLRPGVDDRARLRGRHRGVRRALPLRGAADFERVEAVPRRRARRRRHAVVARLGRRRARRIRDPRARAISGAVIGDLAVRKPWRGRGIGRALLLAALQDAARPRPDRGAPLRRRAERDRRRRRLRGAGMRVARRFDVLEKRSDATGAARRDLVRLPEETRAGAAAPPRPSALPETEAPQGLAVTPRQFAVTTSLRVTGMLRTPSSAMNASRTVRGSSSGQIMPVCGDPVLDDELGVDAGRRAGAVAHAGGARDLARSPT